MSSPRGPRGTVQSLDPCLRSTHAVFQEQGIIVCTNQKQKRRIDNLVKRRLLRELRGKRAGTRVGTPLKQQRPRNAGDAPTQTAKLSRRGGVIDGR